VFISKNKTVAIGTVFDREGLFRLHYTALRPVLYNFNSEGSAPVSVVQSLLDLQEIDGRIRALQQESKDIPQRKNQESARLQGARSLVEQAKNDLKSAQLTVSKLEGDVKALRDKILELKKHQAQLKTNKEFSAYNLEIAKIEKDIDVAEANLIGSMDHVTPCKTVLDEREAKLKEEQAVVDTYCAELDARLAEVNAELLSCQKARAEATKLIQPRELFIYDRLLTKRWPVVVLLQEDGVCKGCNLQQPPSILQGVRRRQGLVACQMCGRIVYQ
jgi:predicted  nucleic acid-binding Zn-ribbon protein